MKKNLFFQVVALAVMCASNMTMASDGLAAKGKLSYNNKTIFGYSYDKNGGSVNFPGNLGLTAIIAVVAAAFTMWSWYTQPAEPARPVEHIALIPAPDAQRV